MDEFYRTNSDFRGYVNRFCRTYNLTMEEALQHALVREAEKYYRKRK